MVWYTYQQNLKISDRFSLQSDIQERHFYSPLKQSQFLLRSIFKTAIKENWSFGLGFAFFLTNTDPSTDYELEVPELRPCLEFSNRQQFKRVSLSHRYRLESRFFQNSAGKELRSGYYFGNMRFRYQFGLDILLNKPKQDRHALKLKIQEEMMLNFGSKIKYNLFDQNRVYILLHYAPVPQLGIEIGYIDLFQQRTAGDDYFNRNILKIGLIQNITLKKKAKQAR